MELAAPSVLWSSDLCRARQTARYVAEHTGLTPLFDSRLREYALGENRMGLTIAEYAERFPGEHAHLVAGRTDLIAGRETTADVLARFLPALSELAAATGEGETGVAVTHGAALKVAVIAFLGLPENSEKVLAGIGNCAWAELTESAPASSKDRPGWRLLAYNVTARHPNFVEAAPVS
jgi:glucosyl-3-phosphoglycerate phosphatase